jgi:hypothetical protein
MYLVLGLLVAYAAAGIEWFVKQDTYTAISYAVVVPLLLFLPRFFYRIGTVRRAWRTYVEQLAFVLVLLNAVGTVYFHTAYFSARAPFYQYDRVLHFSSAFLIVPLLIVFWIVIHGRLGNPRTTLRWVMLIAGVGLFGWEGWQYFNDVVFGSHSFFDYAQSIRYDFWEDIAMGALGLLMTIPYTRRMMPRFRAFLR